MESILVEMKLPGMHQITARLVQAGGTLADTTETVLALECPAWQELPVQVHCLGRPAGSGQVPCHPPADPAGSAGSPASVLLAAHPETLASQDWEALCNAVEAGGTAVVGALRPDHSAALSAFARHGINLKLHLGIGSWMGCYHWVPQSSLFTGLPAGGLAKKPYTNVIPKYVLSELGGETLAGSLRNTQSRLEAPRMLWYSDIEAVRLGKGTVVFCQYRVFEPIDSDPLAGRLAFNLLAYAGQLLEKQ